MKIKKYTLLAFICLFLCSLITGCDGGTAAVSDYAEHRDAEGAVAKKGVCVSRYNSSSQENGDRINALNGSWWYNWGLTPTNEYIDAEFVPMVWGADQVTDENIAYLTEQYQAGNITHLLTFNEPDLTDQANMTVDEAISLWDSLEQIGIPLSSPAVSYYDSEKGNAWLDGFMEKAAEQGLRVDFIAVHCYQSFYSDGAVSALKTMLEALYNKYNLPIWLTEFGAIDIIARDSSAGSSNPTVSASCTLKNAQSYMTEVTDMLERCGYVERYSWFLDNFNETGSNRAWEAPYTSLYNDDDSISGVGQTYSNITSVISLTLETDSLPAAVLGEEYSQTISVCGGTGNYTFTATGLPQGLSMSKGGVLSGAPTSSGIYTLTVTITDSGSSSRRQTLTHKYVLTVNK